MKRLSWLLIALITTGCAWLPENGKRAEMNSAPALNETMKTAKALLPVKGRWLQADWWRQFKQPALDELINTALKDSPKLKQVAARLQQAQSLADVQAADLYPTINGNISFSAQRFSANSVQVKLAGEHFRHLMVDPFMLRYHLDLWGRDEAALQAAIGKAYAAETELADARLLLASFLAKAYFGLVMLNAQNEAAGRLISCHSQLITVAKSALENGLSTAGPLLEAESGLLKARQRQASLLGQIERQKNLLAVLAGKGPDWGKRIIADAAFASFQPEVPAALPLHLLSHRPDVQAAKMRAQAAAEEIKAAQSAFYPDVNLIAFSGLHSVSLSDVLLQGSSLAYAVGPSVDFPIFEGGRLRAQLSFKEAAFNEAAEIYNASVLRAVQDVADAVEKWKEAAVRLQEQKELLVTLEKTRNLAEALHRQGLKDRTDSIRARAAEFEQHLQMAALQGESYQSAIELYTTLGGGYATLPAAR